MKTRQIKDPTAGREYELYAKAYLNFKIAVAAQNDELISFWAESMAFWSRYLVPSGERGPFAIARI